MTSPLQTYVREVKRRRGREGVREGGEGGGGREGKGREGEGAMTVDFC